MSERPSSNSRDLIPQDLDLEDFDEFVAAAGKIDWSRVGGVAEPQSYRLALGGRPIQLGGVPFRILLYLASRPYHAFTRKEIAAAVGTVEAPLTPENVDEQVTLLRDQLGILHDYVQTVPFVGYRFKA